MFGSRLARTRALPLLLAAWTTRLGASVQTASGAVCPTTVVSNLGDTCESIASAYGVTVGQFIQNNPDLTNCRLAAGKTYCVGTISPTSSSTVASGSHSALSPSLDGSCGTAGEYTCLGSAFGDCCSRNGYCGNTSGYCGAGCQPAFGRCDSAASAPSPKCEPDTLTVTSTSTVAAAPETETITIMTVIYEGPQTITETVTTTDSGLPTVCDAVTTTLTATVTETQPTTVTETSAEPAQTVTLTATWTATHTDTSTITTTRVVAFTTRVATKTVTSVQTTTMKVVSVARAAPSPIHMGTAQSCEPSPLSGRSGEVRG